MTHADPYELATIAAGGAIDAALRAHLDSCAECRLALQEWQSTVTDPSDDDLPSPGVWRRIHESLGMSAETADDPLRRGADSVKASPHTPTRRRPRSGSRRRPPAARRGVWIAAVAAATVVSVTIGVIIGVRIGAPSAPQAPTVVAKATLAPFPGWDDTGQAIVEQTAAGERYLTVVLTGSVPDGDVREVWLMRSDLKALISLGLLEKRTGRFAVPVGIDLAQYDIVDVSAEPVDGNPAHSGDSIVRGALAPS